VEAVSATIAHLIARYNIVPLIERLACDTPSEAYAAAWADVA